MTAATTRAGFRETLEAWLAQPNPYRLTFSRTSAQQVQRGLIDASQIERLSPQLQRAVCARGGVAHCNERLALLDGLEFPLFMALLGQPDRRHLYDIEGLDTLAEPGPCVLIVPHIGLPLPQLLMLSDVLGDRIVSFAYLNNPRARSRLTFAEAASDETGVPRELFDAMPASFGSVVVLPLFTFGGLVQAERLLRRDHRVLLWQPDGIQAAPGPSVVETCFLGYERRVGTGIARLVRSSAARVVFGALHVAEDPADGLQARLRAPFSHDELAAMDPVAMIRAILDEAERDICAHVDEWATWQFVTPDGWK